MKREEAVAIGAYKYTRGRVCPRCGGTEAYTNRRMCVGCAALNYKKPSYLAKSRLRTANRAARLLNAMPSWVDMVELELIYALCPPGYHVDHIVPLKGKGFVGLHVPWNLQYLPGEKNISKSNKLPPEEMWRCGDSEAWNPNTCSAVGQASAILEADLLEEGEEGIPAEAA